MPRFSNLDIEKDNEVAGLEDVFKGSQSTAIVDDLRNKYRARAAEILRTSMPSKITLLQSLLAGEDDPASILFGGKADSGDYVRPRRAQPGDVRSGKVVFEGIDPLEVVIPSEITGHAMSRRGVEANDEDGGESRWYDVVPVNKEQQALVSLTLKEFEDLHMMAMDLKVWLEMEIPLIEDGNSFGADVQAHLIAELNNIQQKATRMYESTRKHSVDRLGLLKDWVKYPNLMDYPYAIAASDQFDHYFTRGYLRNLLVTYGGLLTKFERNWPKVIHPKGSGSSGGMY